MEIVDLIKMQQECGKLKMHKNFRQENLVYL